MKLIGIIALGALIMSNGVANAQLPSPQLKVVYPLGGKAGTTLEVRLEGEHLDDAHSLRFSHRGIIATPKLQSKRPFEETPRKVTNTFEVTIADDVPPGLYDVRAAGYFGVSNPRVFAVDRLTQHAAQHEHRTMESAMELPVNSSVSARAAAEQIHYYRLHVPSGKKVLVECFAERLDSRMDATLVLFDEDGKELRRVRDSVGTDPLLVLQPTNDTTYIVGVYDFTYRGGGDFFYRLSAHTHPRLLYAFPPVGTIGQTQRATLFGWNLPGGQQVPAELSKKEAPLEWVETDIALQNDACVAPNTASHSLAAPGTSHRITEGDAMSNDVIISTSDLPIVQERAENDTPQTSQPVPVSCELVGRILPAGDSDWITFTANQGDVLELDAIAHRMGVQADLVLTVHRVTLTPDGQTQSNQLANADDDNYGRAQHFDISSTDPRIRIRADQPAVYRVQIRDLYGNPTNDPRLMYRLSIRRNRPAFRLAAFVAPSRGQDNQALPISNLSLRGGSTGALTVAVQRLGGFDGPIDVSVQGLPKGVTCPGAHIRADESRATLLLTADVDVMAYCGEIQIAGAARDDTAKSQTAVGGTTVWPSPNVNTAPPARLTESIYLAVTPSAVVPASLSWTAPPLTGGPPSPKSDQMLQPLTTCVGGKLTLPIHVRRRAGSEFDVALSANGLADGITFKADPIKKDQKSTTVELFVNKNNVKPGTYELHLRSKVAARLPRNPAAIENATEFQARVAQALAELSEQATQAIAKRDAKQADVIAKLREIDQLRSLLATASELVKGRIASRVLRQHQFDTAAARIADADPSEIASQLAAAKNQLADAIEAVRKAKLRQIQAEADLATAQAHVDVLQVELAALIKTAEAAQAKQKQTEELRKQADSELDAANKQHGAKDYQFELISPPLRIDVAASPVTLSSSTQRCKVLIDGTTQIPVSVVRAHGFADTIQIRLDTPAGSGLSADAISITPSKESGIVTIRAGDAARLGLHRCQLTASMRFNDVDIQTRVPLQVRVQPKGSR